MNPIPLALIAALLVAGAAAAPAITGDWNGNGRLDFADIVGLFVGLGGDYRPDCDLNMNGRLDFADVVLLWEAV